MRQLSDTFMANLRDGFLAPILQRVRADKDLDLQIRNNYLNIYYKGNSLLKLSEAGANRYKPEIHRKFLGDMVVSDMIDEHSTALFLRQIPQLKENIIEHGKSSLEVEYEQLIIRANNNERRNNSEYFIVDRQYTTAGRDRFDLTGIFWDRKRRRKGQEVPLCFMEVKFALNTVISKVHEQLNRYYDAIAQNAVSIAREAQTIFRQKLDLGLYDQRANRLAAMKTLVFATDIRQFQFILILVDYNPHSQHLARAELSSLPFADQVKLFNGGFAIWKRSLADVSVER